MNHQGQHKRRYRRNLERFKIQLKKKTLQDIHFACLGEPVPVFVNVFFFFFL